MLTVVVGSPFSGKDRWITQEIERREPDEVGLLHLSYSGIFAAIATGTESTYRDERISDSGAARYAAFLLAVALREAHARELEGYVAVDSPRRAVQAVQQSPGGPMVEVTVTQQEATRRAVAHVELLRDLVPRAAADDGEEAQATCRKMVDSYFNERDLLPPDINLEISILTS